MKISFVIAMALLTTLAVFDTRLATAQERIKQIKPNIVSAAAEFNNPDMRLTPSAPVDSLRDTESTYPNPEYMRVWLTFQGAAQVHAGPHPTKTYGIPTEGRADFPQTDKIESGSYRSGYVRIVFGPSFTTNYPGTRSYRVRFAVTQDASGVFRLGPSLEISSCTLLAPEGPQTWPEKEFSLDAGPAFLSARIRKVGSGVCSFVLSRAGQQYWEFYSMDIVRE